MVTLLLGSALCLSRLLTIGNETSELDQIALRVLKLDSSWWFDGVRIAGISNDGNDVIFYLGETRIGYQGAYASGYRRKHGYMLPPAYYEKSLVDLTDPDLAADRKTQWEYVFTGLVLEDGLALSVKTQELKSWRNLGTDWSEWLFHPLDLRVDTPRSYRIRFGKQVLPVRLTRNKDGLDLVVMEKLQAEMAQLARYRFRLPSAMAHWVGDVRWFKREEIRGPFPLPRHLSRSAREWGVPPMRISHDLKQAVVSNQTHIDLSTGKSRALPGRFGKLFFFSGKLLKSIGYDRTLRDPGNGLFEWSQGAWKFVAPVFFSAISPNGEYAIFEGPSTEAGRQIYLCKALQAR